jgi:outer membrane receptor protein involved in Fe transport
MMRTTIATGVSLFLIMVLAIPGFSQTTGKIAGSVVDKETGEPLPGANIIVVGTTMGAATDMSGEFYIINVPPGTYTIEAQMMGYASMQMIDVRVYVNRTIPVDFKMSSTVIEGEVVTVKADKIVMKKDQTSSIRNISSEDIENLPAESVTQVVSMQPGVVGSHFRGGRSDEVTYLIDGVSVTDAFSQQGRIASVNTEIVEDVEVITGTFNAEYGNAMSGVVNIVTKEGNNDFHGDISVNYGNYLTPHKDIFEGLDDSEFDRIRDFKGTVTGPVFSNRLFFVANGRYEKNLGHLNAIRLFRVTDFSDYTPELESDWHIESTGDSAYVPMDWSENYSAYGKLTLRASNSLRFSLAGTYNNGQGKGYSHSFRFNPDGVGGWHNKSYLGIFSINHMLSKSAFYDLKLSYSDYWNGNYLYEDPLDPRYVHDQYLRNNGPYFYTGGQSKGHTRRSERKANVKWDFTWQFNKNHSLKTGFDLTRTELDQEWHSIRNAYEGTPYENMYIEENGKRTYLFYRPTIHDNKSVNTDEYLVRPFQGAFYLQDKMEFNMMVVNFGVRFDYFDPNRVYPTNYRNPANQEYFEQAERISTYPKADPKYQISPRLGLSYNLGGSALLRFAYGHFLQLPSLERFYQNSSFIVAASDFATTTGNAQLNPQKTIQYEVGLFQQLTDEMSLEVAVWYKDIYDLVTATVYTTYNQTRYGVFANKEYGNARGLELKYDFRKDFLSAGFNYTFGYTRGVADSPTSTFSRAGDQMDPVNKLIPMNWDQRHTFNIYIGYNAKNYGSTLLWYVNSGQPYTWSPLAENPISGLHLFPNNQYRPTRLSLDLNAYYNLTTYRGMNFRLTLLVYNLLDRLNENSVNSQTGRAYTAIVRETDITGHRSVFSTYEDVYQNPAMYSSPRSVKVGLGVTF